MPDMLAPQPEAKKTLTNALDKRPVLLAKEVPSVVTFSRGVLWAPKIEVYTPSRKISARAHAVSSFAKRRRTYRICSVDDLPGGAHNHVRVVPA